MRSLRKTRAARAGLVTLVSLSLIAGVASYVPEAEAKPLNRPAPATQNEKSTPGKDFVPKPVSAPVAATLKPVAAPVWPEASSASASTAGLVRGSARKVGTSPISMGTAASTTSTGAASAVKVDTLSQADSSRLGVSGLVLRMTRTDAQAAAAKVNVKVDYSKFATAFGGDWSNRLRLVEMACATPTSCVEKRVLPASHNDTRSKVVSADVDLPAVPAAGARSAGKATAPLTTMALVAAPAGPSGSYAATPLSASSTWNVGAQTGDFSWSYPLRVPPGTAGPRPDLSINYSAGSVDGQVASTNNQTSWIGQGHSLEPGFIERKYVSCADDVTNSNTTIKTGDQCWKSDNATLSLGGHSGELVKIDNDTFKLENDDGTRIQRLHGAANTAQNGEHWLVTTTDGTSYYFGLNPLVSGTERSNSVNTVPVFGNQVGEPCNKPTFAASSCTQGWRWNVDRVIDVSGNQMSYRYVQENNYYGRNNNTAVSQYQRASYPSMIEYGQKGNLADPAVVPAATSARVRFVVAERCTPSGAVTCDPAQLTAANAAKWPDVPFDQLCTSATTCPNRTSPSFFTRKRLLSVNTEILKGTTFSPVDTWTLTQDYPPADSPSLFLGLHHPPGQGRDYPDQPQGEFRRDRLAEPSGRSGRRRAGDAQVQDLRDPVGVRSDHQCELHRSTVLVGLQTGERGDQHDALLPGLLDDRWRREPDKALVPQIRRGQRRRTRPVHRCAGHGHVVPVLGPPAWHFDDNELTLPKYRSWGDWRGYSKVERQGRASWIAVKNAVHLLPGYAR